MRVSGEVASRIFRNLRRDHRFLHLLPLLRELDTLPWRAVLATWQWNRRHVAIVYSRLGWWLGAVRFVWKTESPPDVRNPSRISVLLCLRLD